MKSREIDMTAYGLERLPVQETEARPYIGRVLSQSKGIYRVVCEKGELFASVSGKLRYEAGSELEYPVTGDFVQLGKVTEEDKVSVIRRILPRKSIFLRRAPGRAEARQAIAANIDTVFLCMSLNEDFNLRRLERYLTLAWESGATPVVVLTKADLCENVERKIWAAASVAIGVELVVTTAMEKDGYEELRGYIRHGQTVAFVGSSGVGKSTLINCLLGEQRLKQNPIRKDGKGRHTTTSRELILLPEGGMVIDTPGMRELGMWNAEKGLSRSFADVEQFLGKCRFKNCTHKTEPGCAVYEAILAGELSERRWQAYRKLGMESAYTRDRQDYLENKEKKFKQIAKLRKSSCK